METSITQMSIRLLLLLLISSPIVTSDRPSVTQQTNIQSIDVCQTQTFDADCEQDEVIVMTSARYGRMQLGSCVQSNLGFLGCYSDVLAILDDMCSGRRSCSVRIPDPRLDITEPCNKELKSYLEASFVCVQVIAPMNSCEGHAAKLSRSHGYLSSYVAKTTGCGSERSPWLLQVDPGLRIAVSFYDFSASDFPVYGGLLPQTQCDELAFIIDKTSGQKVKLCPRVYRQSTVYTSVNNSLEITLRTQNIQKEDPHFLIYFQSVGCSDKTPPQGMTFHQTSQDTAQLRCHDSEQYYDLICKEGQWIGHVQNCTKVVEHLQDNPQHPSSGGSSTMDSLLLVCLIAISLVICFILIATVAICLKRINRRHQQPFFQYPRSDAMHASYDAAADKHSLKTLHIDNHDLQIRNHDVIYRPLLRSNQNSATPQPQADCLLCQSQSRDQSYDFSSDDCRFYTSNNTQPRYTTKQSNIRNDLSLKLPKKMKGTGTDIRKKLNRSTGDVLDDDKLDTGYQPRKSIDCDVMTVLTHEPRVIKQVDKQCVDNTDPAQCCLLNNTL